MELDHIFEILQNERRRHVLRFLRASNEPLGIGELAESIAALENNKDRDQITSRERKRVYVGLYQVHLPKMSGLGIISFNKPRGIVEPGANICLFDEYLFENPVSSDRLCPWTYALVSATGIFAMILAMNLESVVGWPLAEIAGVTAVTALALCSIRDLMLRKQIDLSTLQKLDPFRK